MTVYIVELKDPDQVSEQNTEIIYVASSLHAARQARREYHMENGRGLQDIYITSHELNSFKKGVDVTNPTKKVNT